MLPEYLVDASPFAVHAGARPVAAAVACGSAGVGEQVVGVAVVVASRKPGMLAWGHASLRVVACVDGEVSDREYEAYRLGAWNERLLAQEHEGEAFAADGSLAARRGSLVLFRNEAAVDGGWFAQVGEENRDLWEIWLDLPPERLAAVSAGARAWYDAQQETLASERPLPERYVPWRRNCTAVLRDLLPELDPGSALPFAWLRALEPEATLRVVHPSPHRLRALGAADRTRRTRAVLPARATLDPASVPGRALGPWTEGGPVDR